MYQTSDISIKFLKCVKYHYQTQLSYLDFLFSDAFEIEDKDSTAYGKIIIRYLYDVKHKLSKTISEKKGSQLILFFENFEDVDNYIRSAH